MVVKRNCQVVRFYNFEHMRARMAQLFCKSSRRNIYLLIQSKKIEVKGQDLSKILKKAKGVWFALCPRKVRYISHLWAKIKYLKSAVIPIFKLNLSRYESDLSNEVLCSLVAQRNVELLKIKVEVWKKKWSYLTPVHTFSSRPWFVRWFFPDLQIWPTAVLQPFELQGCTVPQLKDLIHICLDLA